MDLSVRLTLLCHGATRSMREGAFPSAEELLDAGGVAKVSGFVLPGGILPCSVSPWAAPRQTAALLGVSAHIDPALADIDNGPWAGRSFIDVHASDAAGFAAWLEEPSAGAPIGESLGAVRSRMTAWLAERIGGERSVLAITHPMIMRATLAAALDIPIEASMRIDIVPLCAVRLSWNRVWRLQSIG